LHDSRCQEGPTFDIFVFKPKEMKYNRVLLKLSGEALMGEKDFGIDPKRIAEYAEEIKAVV